MECEADLIEEVGRIIGYDNILPHAPMRPMRSVTQASFHSLRRKIKTFLAGHGESFEVMTYPSCWQKSAEEGPNGCIG